MLCREQVAQLVEVYPRLLAAGISLAVVGNGNVAQARAFSEERSLPFPLYTDPTLATYAAAGMKRGVSTVVSLQTLRMGRVAAAHGHRQGATQGDPWQQGGAHLILPDGKLVYSQISEVAGDHFSPDDAIRAFESAVQRGRDTVRR